MTLNIKIILVAPLFLIGCSSNLIKPEQLQPPKKTSCIFLSEPITYREKVTKLFASANYDYQFQRGPYISEKVGEEGTYFRGPPGAISVINPELKDKPSGLLTHMVRDGGILVPHDRAKPPRLYSYFSMSDASAVVPDINTTCSSFAALKDPDTSKLSVVSFAAGGSLGGILGRAMVPQSPMSYGQAAVGGVIAGALIAAIINSDVGKIITWDSNDESFISKLKNSSSSIADLKVIDISPTNETKTLPLGSHDKQ